MVFDFKLLKTSQMNNCFQYKRCRHWATFLFDVCEEYSLLEGAHDFLRTAYAQMKDLVIMANVVQENNFNVNQQISEEYFEKDLKYQNNEEVAIDYKKAMEFYVGSIHQFKEF